MMKYKAPDISEEDINDIIELRKQARDEKNWEEADRLREELAARGIE